MLNMYQLWLDDLYPRAKFADGLAMIEALGHKKRIHLMRREWMDEGKPKGSPDTDPEENGEKDTAPAAATESDTAQMEGIQAGGIDVESEHRTPTQDEPPPKPSESAQAPIDDGNPDEDDLDALLAESADLDMPSVPPPQTVPAQGDDPFADDLEAMAEMEGMW
jgi:replication fork protection complex subunit Csm3/Swi3